VDKAKLAHGCRVSRFGFVNVYLVREEDGLTVIDTAISGSANAILTAAEELGAPIRRIVLTHAHGDHVGSLDALAAEAPWAEVLISGREARLLRKDKSMEPGEPDAKLRGGFPGPETQPTRTFEPGDMIGSLQVVAAPGHTPGHVALFDTRDRTLYCGDAYSTLGGIAACAKFNPRFPLVWLATWHKPTALETARSLLDLDLRALAPGHGKVIPYPRWMMEQAVTKAG
jgi:glyoxylase-like metal-dependent hydrolase (beta-lactamase superfamily II)